MTNQNELTTEQQKVLTTIEILEQLNERIEENNKVLDELKKVLSKQV